MAAVTTRYFLFPVGNFISGFGFSAVRWWIVGILLMETWGFVISLATCQPGNSSEYWHVERVLVQGPDPSGPGHADSPPVLRHWQLVVLKYFYSINEYSSRKLLVSGRPSTLFCRVEHWTHWRPQLMVAEWQAIRRQPTRRLFGPDVDGYSWWIIVA